MIAHVAPALNVGVSGRWSWTRENFRLAPAGAAGQVYETQGLGARGPIDVAGGTGPYVRRLTITRWEVGPELGGAVGVAEGRVATRYNSSSIPDPTGLEASYQRLIGPALAWRAAQVVPWEAGLSLRQRVGAVALLLRGTYGQVTAVSEPLPLQPGGDRGGWTVLLALER